MFKDKCTKFTITCAILLLSTIAIQGCSKKEQPSAETKSNVYAYINDQAITQAEIDTFLKFKGIQDPTSKQAQRQIDDFIYREALTKSIEKQSLLDSSLVEIEMREFKKEMMISRYFETYLSDKVSSDAMRNYYNSNPDEFSTEKVKVAHILVRTSPTMSKEERQSKLTLIHQIHAKASNNPDFETLAKQYSEDQASGQNGGSLGWIKRGDVSKEFSDAAFSLNEGGVSDPISTPFGFHILKVEQAAETVKQPYDQVKGDIRYKLRQLAKKAETERLEKASLVKLVKETK